MTLAPYLDTHNAIVGASGAGKTVTAKGQVEQLLANNRHVAIIDPTGAWWGLQSNASGTGPGFDIPIFGGPHGNIAITPSDGAAVAGVIVDERVSAILDLSEFHDEEDLRAFVLAFVERLRAKEPANFHLIVDEADEFCPQTAPDSVGYRLIRQMTWVAKRGRLRGFVLTAITQRPADISKAVLSQMQTIVAHQLIAPQDQGAIDAYLKANATKAIRDEVMASLAGLGRGERWVYSPALALLERAKSPPLSTFDSSSTPAPGEKRAVPKRLSEIDVSAIAAALARPAAPIAAGAGEDTAPLHAQIAELSARIAQSEERERAAERRLSLYAAAAAAIANQAADLYAKLGGAPAGTARIEAAEQDAEAGNEGSSGRDGAGAVISAQAGVGGAVDPPAPRSRWRAERDVASGASVELAPRHQKILDQIAWAAAFLRRPEVPRDVLAWLCESHPRTKGYLNALGELRSAGLIDYPAGGVVALTDVGAVRAERPPRPPRATELQAAVIARLEPRHGEILKALLDKWPGGVSRDELAVWLEYHPRTKSFLNGLGRMRSLGVIEYPAAGVVRPAAYLFEVSS